MDFNKKDFYGIAAKERKQVQITIDQDCNVPDTKPDIEKIIQTKGTVLMQETEMMVDKVRMKGELHFQGLYGTNDPRTFLDSLEYSLPFEEYIHIDGVLPADYVKVKYSIDDINTVLINSRKLSIRVLLTFILQVSEEIKEEAITDILDDGVSTLKKEIQVTDLIVNKKDIARLKEELVLPANKANIYQMLWSQIDMENLQAKLADHVIEIQGIMHVFLLYIGEDEQMPVQYARWEIPVHTELECYECAPGMVGKVGMTTGNQQMEIRPDVDGEERVIALDVTLDCDIKIYEDQTMTYVDDGYKMDAKLVPEYRMFDFETLIGKNQAIMKAAKKFPIQQEPGKLLQVLSVKGSCNIDEIEMTDQGLNVEGVWIADVLYLSSEDQTPVMSDSYMEPFTFFVEARGLNEGDDYQVDVRLDQMTGMPTEGDEIEIKVSIVFDFISFRKKQQRVMIHVNEEPLDYEMIQQIPGIVGYIVKEDDTLWSIAKTFFTTIESIREQNDGIEEVNPGDKLLIVKESGCK
ncbi:DUF3794 and LysM peptidoglycan-binding domain-containing protein [Anaerostipes sp.]|uniref:DUF3794 and LysM peptidoglycan-binding domain-containing protein n=1 Tax=Anaerostipes sp. TaxID=1872530 RepID=UPI0025898ECD|nr:SPOCS domain-containing protein [Anaerostipes sp.]MCI5623460.1 DUF3794 domain-containing protein [Anaerostipes sp.]MDY2726497.1 DUF3794 domain-containing protein [Anaerostipes faecalis]